jgi:hypothetical protein
LQNPKAGKRQEKRKKKKKEEKHIFCVTSWKIHQHIPPFQDVDAETVPRASKKTAIEGCIMPHSLLKAHCHPPHAGACSSHVIFFFFFFFTLIPNLLEFINWFSILIPTKPQDLLF